MQKKTKSTLKPEKKAVKEIHELKPKLTQEEINSLEQMIQENKQIIESPEFQEIFKNQTINLENFSPSLQKINAPQKTPIMLERDVITGNMSLKSSNKEEENQDFKYLPNGIEEENKRYTPYYGGAIASSIQKNEMQKISSKSILDKKEISFQPPIETKITSQESFERYSSPMFHVEKFEKDKKNKKDIFDKKQIKYSPDRY